ncbi:MAG: GNAT family N-acetyltransferase [Gluconacetobacter diazotrophicus]|nr:GNAT family N-acetyltransferase [Gluconacetobacter diazotrophicus]
MTPPGPVRIERLRPDDCDDALLALNNDHQAELSPLTLPRLRELVARCFLPARVGAADALLLSFDQDAQYDSPNFLWFRARHARFVYVDRVVVAPSRRGEGLAGALYDLLAETAFAAGHVVLACEVNLDPPNPGSDRFHRRAGFRPVGEAEVGGGKRVRYWECALSDPAT